MSDYKPSTEELRQVWGMFSEYGGLVDRPEETLIDERYAEFDRWLETVKVEAWDEGQDSVTLYQDIYGATMEYADNPYKDAP